MACLEPKLLRKPKGDWLCPECKGASPAGEDVDSAAFPCMEDGPWTDDPLNPTLYTIPEEPLTEAQHALDQNLTLLPDTAPPAPVDATPPCAAGIRGSTRVRKPVQRYSPIFLMLHILKCADTFIDNATIHGYEPDPTTLSEALSSRNADEWVAATVSEMTSLMEKGTFDIVDRTPDMKPISAKWVFKSKFDAFGFLVKRKARLVCRGFLQTYGVDYYDVFSPVSKQATLRTLLAYAAANDLEIEQIDINVAFLNADLDETVYVDIPPGLEGVYPGKTMKLHKALYGLKQAPRVWWLNISTFLSKHGFVPTLSDTCLFIKQGKHGKVLLLVYVDDILCVGHKSDVAEAIALIQSEYAADYMGAAKSFLGQAISRDRSKLTITLSQPQFVKDLAKKFTFDMGHLKSVSIPISPDYKPDSDKAKTDKPMKPENNNYASLVGSLLYLANCTRPDISFAVGALSRHLNSPQASHMGKAKQLLRYVMNTADYGLTFGPSTSMSGNSVELVGYSDSDYGSNFLPLVPDQSITRRSVTGFIFLINGTPVAWQSRKQQTVSRSTDEAEYQAMATAASMGLWLRKLLAEIEAPAKKLQMFADNQAAIEHVHSPGSIRKSKHVDITHQFVLDRQTRGDLDFTYVPSADNIADIFTKGLVKETFEKLRGMMGVHKIV